MFSCIVTQYINIWNFIKIQKDFYFLGIDENQEHNIKILHFIVFIKYNHILYQIKSPKIKNPKGGFVYPINS
jgi:hypothetical protein